MLRMLFNRVKKHPRQDKPETNRHFWHWFSENIDACEQFLESGAHDFTIVHALNTALRRYSSALIAELEKDRNGVYVLTISPDGHKQGIEATRELVKAAPAFRNWKIVGFKQPVAPDRLHRRVDNPTFLPESVKVHPVLSENGDTADLRIYLSDHDANNEHHQHLAFLYIGLAIGEYNIMQHVRYIHFWNSEEQKPSMSNLSLEELQNWFRQTFD